MAARDPDVRRALVTEVAEDGSTARVLVEWMRVLRGQDAGAIQAEAPQAARGVEALAIPGLAVGDEVLVDLRSLPVIRLSLLFFLGPVLCFGMGLLAGQWLGTSAGLPPPLTLALQLALGGTGGVLAFLYADRVQSGLRAQGLGTPQVTAIMPRFLEEVAGDSGARGAMLQAVFFLTAPVPAELWSFAAAEFERISGVHAADLHDGRVEIVFHSGILKEKHLHELLVMLGFPVDMGRDPE